MSERKPSVFISYSHKDEEWKDKLVRQLQIPAEHHGFAVWHDGQIRVGDEWRERIGAALETTQIAVLLISAEFLNSTFIKTHEVPLLLDLRRRGRVEIVPVLVGACPWKSVAWLERLELRPKDGEALESLSAAASNELLARVAEEIDAKLTQAVKKAVGEQARAGAISSTPPGVVKAGQQPAQPVGPRMEAPPAVLDPPKPAPARPVERTSTTADVGDGSRSLPSLLKAAARSLPAWLIGLTALALGLYLWLRAKPGPVGPSPAPSTSLAATPPPPRVIDGYEEDLGGGMRLSMVRIRGGTFLMGSGANEAGRLGHEGPQRTVTVAPFFLGQFEVTQAQWRAVAGWPQVARALAEAPSRFQGDNLPVEQVSWDEAVEFCARLSRRMARAYRLPSEAEWEYAARAGTMTPYHFGETITRDLANYEDDSLFGRLAKGEDRERTMAVGSFKVLNAFGLFDMHGNVREWVEDDWHDSYEGAPVDGRAWAKRTRGSARVVRGGSWSLSARDVRAAKRDRLAPGDRADDLGFRCVRVDE